MCDNYLCIVNRKFSDASIKELSFCIFVPTTE